MTRERCEHNKAAHGSIQATERPTAFLNSQVALTKTVCTVQVNEAAGAFGWRLAADEVDALDMESSRLKPSLANPVENF